jgi:hypothetical protein
MSGLFTKVSRLWRNDDHVDDELRARDEARHLRDMTDNGDPKLQRIVGSRVGWEDLNSRPAETEWNGD